MEIGKILIYAGIALIVAGVLFMAVHKFFPLGHLPGDLEWQWGGTKVYFPIISCLLVSIIGSILLNLFFRR